MVVGNQAGLGGSGLFSFFKEKGQKKKKKKATTS